MQSLPQLTTSVQADKERAIRRRGPLPENPYAALAHPIGPVPGRTLGDDHEPAAGRRGTVRPGVATGA
jgi:hypothetical protein